MYFLPAKREYPVNVWGFSPAANVALVLCALLTLVFGIQPALLYGPSVVGGDSLQAAVSGRARIHASPASVPAPVVRASVR